MFCKVLFKPRPRCFRDKLELWFVFRNGMCERFNLAGLIPYTGVPIGLVAGIITTFMINPAPEIPWDNPIRYMPVLLVPALCVIIGLFIRHGIIGEYYLEPFPELDEQALERILEDLRSGKRSSRKKSKPSRRSNTEDD